MSVEPSNNNANRASEISHAAINNRPVPQEELSTERKVALVVLAALAVLTVVLSSIFFPLPMAFLACLTVATVALVIAAPILRYRPVIVEEGRPFFRRYTWAPLFVRTPQRVIYSVPRPPVVVISPRQQPVYFPFYRQPPVIHFPRHGVIPPIRQIRVHPPVRAARSVPSVHHGVIPPVRQMGTRTHLPVGGTRAVPGVHLNRVRRGAVPPFRQ